MKLAGAKAASFFHKPDPAYKGILIFGADGARVMHRRQQLVEALIGERGEEEMRLTRVAAADVRKDPALVADAIKAQGFFPGSRVLLVEDATDGLANILEAALSDWREGDANLVVTAGQLNARSKLRKVFEAPQNTVSVGIYDDPPSRSEIEQVLHGVGLTDVKPDGLDALLALAQDLEPGDFAQTVEKLSLYMIGAGSVGQQDVEACAPASSDADVEDAIHLIAEAKPNALGPLLKRLFGQGVAPTTLCIGAQRHFRSLYAAACHPQGPEAALSRARPPVFGPRKDRMIRQARGWGQARLERALAALIETDLALRSSRPHPAHALLERTFIRIAMMRPK